MASRDMGIYDMESKLEWEVESDGLCAKCISHLFSRDWKFKIIKINQSLDLRMEQIFDYYL